MRVLVCLPRNGSSSFSREMAKSQRKNPDKDPKGPGKGNEAGGAKIIARRRRKMRRREERRQQREEEKKKKEQERERERERKRQEQEQEEKERERKTDEAIARRDQKGEQDRHDKGIPPSDPKLPDQQNPD